MQVPRDRDSPKGSFNLPAHDTLFDMYKSSKGKFNIPRAEYDSLYSSNVHSANKTVSFKNLKKHYIQRRVSCRVYYEFLQSTSPGLKHRLTTHRTDQAEMMAHLIEAENYMVRATNSFNFIKESAQPEEEQRSLTDNTDSFNTHTVKKRGGNLTSGGSSLGFDFSNCPMEGCYRCGGPHTVSHCRLSRKNTRC